MASDVRYSIAEAAELLDRSPHTLRSWDRNGSMPKSLRPKRDEHGHRYWTPELIEKIKEWIVKNHFHPGRGISYEPTPDQLASHLSKIRSTSTGRRNGKHEILREQLQQAFIEMSLPPKQILSNLPHAADEVDVPLGEALIIAAEVVSAQ